jgi:membrane fusion protein (multidrug efflux system)
MSNPNDQTRPDDLPENAGEIDDYVARLIEGEDEGTGAESEILRGEREEEARRKPLYKRPTFLIVAAVVLVVASVIGVRYWLYTRSHESTDDAFVDGHLIQVSPKVSGYVTKVHVVANQEVKEGDLIAEIDARDYEARLEQAKANLDAGMTRLKGA